MSTRNSRDAALTPTEAEIASVIDRLGKMADEFAKLKGSDPSRSIAKAAADGVDIIINLWEANKRSGEKLAAVMPHDIRLAVARSIGKSADETNHMIRADLVWGILRAWLSQQEIDNDKSQKG